MYQQPSQPVSKKSFPIFGFILVLTLFLLIGLLGVGFWFYQSNPNSTIWNGLYSKNSSNFTVSSTRSSVNISSATSPIVVQEPKNQAVANTTTLVDRVLPSVVSIRVKSSSNRQFLGSEAAGTGYVVSEDGLVITNRHVVAQYCQSSALNPITITGLIDSQTAYQMSVESIDPIDDIAILKIKNLNTKLTPLKFADSTKLKMGSDVVAIGNALGEFRNTVTKGIISGLDRTLETDLVDECTTNQTRAEGLIQTDAAINKGNSGGPLFDADGNVVGMNTFGSDNAQSLGFAISANTIVNALNSYKLNGIITRPRLGLVSRPLDPAIKATNLWLPVDYGEIIDNPNGGVVVSKDSGADKAGLRQGDIILEVDGVKLVANNDNSNPLRREVLSKQPNSEIELTVQKSTGINRDGDYTYNSNLEKVRVKLGGITFELKANKANN